MVNICNHMIFSKDEQHQTGTPFFTGK